ncbi:LysR family transcriptional regulator [Diaphorobacter sp. HDW4A]|uniref:LysR family transcriptional regulator n=1 Tax=Diaphorobacter sp. HDW4A TaxID=2714924 RepID=UPI00140E73BB|nr:LysR family transcriptional regulator [Diaphorobacter sp. HDW4A]QIL83702.1 LysR family transcriptional regulator [Diaphorobacter sp. HDW4A]
MRDKEPNWEWYRSFLQVLESGSLSAAARSLGLTQPTLGRHVDSLESALGLKLFTRSQEGFAPTPAALELHPYAANISATAAALRRTANGHGTRISGPVRITASEVMGVEVLPPILASVRDKHPGLVIELVLSNQADDLLQREADIAVRMFRPTQEALIAKNIGKIELGLHAHSSYLLKNGTPKSLNELKRHSLIGFDRETEYIRQMQGRLQGLTRDQFALRSDSDLAQIGAIRAAYGIGLCQVPLAARDPQLVRVLQSQFSMPLDTWVAMHGDLRHSPRCAAAFDALVAGLSDYISA